MAGKKLNADYKMQIFSSTVKCIRSEPAGADVMRCQNNCGRQVVINPRGLVLKTDCITSHLEQQLQDESWLCCTVDCFTLKHHWDLTSEESCH